MQLIRGQLQLTRQLPASVLTLGNFDGVHLGHQQVLRTLCHQAAQLSVPSVVITFEPPPQCYFNPAIEFTRLMYWREKWTALQQYAVDYLVCLHFGKSLAALTAAAFVKDILVAQLGMKSIILGSDARFGAGRQGDIELLRQLGEQDHFDVNVQPNFLDSNKKRISSSQIRQALLHGQLVEANRLLGQPYFLCGRVMLGDQRGRLLGFPTANIDLRYKPVPLQGIFVVTVEGVDAKPWPAVASLGVRPMFDGHDCWLEVHLLDFHGTLYGQRLRVNFLHKLRDECHFDTVAALIEQMHQDVADARRLFETKALVMDGSAS